MSQDKKLAEINMKIIETLFYADPSLVQPEHIEYLLKYTRRLENFAEQCVHVYKESRQLEKKTKV